MHCLPLPPRTQRKSGTPDWKWGRFLFRRHIQHVLKWTARREEGDPSGFGDWLNILIRERLFPEPPKPVRDGQDEGRGEGIGQTIQPTGQGGGNSELGGSGDGRSAPGAAEPVRGLCFGGGRESGGAGCECPTHSQCRSDGICPAVWQPRDDAAGSRRPPIRLPTPGSGPRQCGGGRQACSCFISATRPWAPRF